MRRAVPFCVVLLLSAASVRAEDAEPARFLVRFEDTVRNETPATLRRVTCDLPLPSDGPGQRVLWLRLSPHGFDVAAAPDGARTASARVESLDPGEAVTFAWLAEIELTPRGDDAAPADLDPYLLDDPILGLDDEAIVRSAEQIRADVVSCDPEELLDAALAHVRRNVRYDLDGGWRPAPEVLRRGVGSCSESTFAFVALCRRLGLPARWAGGTLLRGGYDGRAVDSTFHRIAEVHLPGRGFVPVETTSNEAGEGRVPSRLLVLSRDASSDGPAGLYYHARNSWWAPRRGDRPLPGAARAAKVAYWTAAPGDDVDRSAPLAGLPATHRPSFPRAELVLAEWERLAVPGREARSAVAPDGEATLAALAAAGHPAALRVAAELVWRDADRVDAVRAVLADVLDDSLRSSFLPLLGREPSVFAAWWARHAPDVVAFDPGRLTLVTR